MNKLGIGDWTIASRAREGNIRRALPACPRYSRREKLPMTRGGQGEWAWRTRERRGQRLSDCR